MFQTSSFNKTLPTLLVLLLVSALCPLQAKEELSLFGLTIHSHKVVYVREGSRAFDSGVKTGDTIISVSNQSVKEKSDSWIADQLFVKPGDVRSFGVLRDRQKVNCKYKLTRDVFSDQSIVWINRLIEGGKYDRAKALALKYHSEIPESKSLEIWPSKIEYKKLLSEGKVIKAKRIPSKLLNGCTRPELYEEPKLDLSDKPYVDIGPQMDRVAKRLKIAPIEIFWWIGAGNNRPFYFFTRMSEQSEDPKMSYLLAKEASTFLLSTLPRKTCLLPKKELKYAHALYAAKRYDEAVFHYERAINHLSSIDYQRTLQKREIEKDIAQAKLNLMKLGRKANSIKRAK